MQAVFSTNFNVTEDGAILTLENKKIATISRDVLLKKQNEEIEKLNNEIFLLKNLVEAQNKKLTNMMESFKKVMEVLGNEKNN